MGRHVALHAELGAEAVDTLDGARFDPRDQRRVWVQDEMGGDLAAQAAGRAEGRQDELDRRRGVADTVIESPNLVALVHRRRRIARDHPLVAKVLEDEQALVEIGVVDLGRR